MEKYQQQAWDCLTKREQDSLFLNISQGLSTRKTGEVLKMSHYKYLEMKARAEKFFKMFSDYFYLHPSLIRPGAPIIEPFKDYLYGCILKRLPKEEAINYAGDSAWVLREFNTKKITVNMERLKKSEDPWDQDLFKLIMEFDRWNSFRILPQALQAPSAYKRRTNKKYKIYLRYLHRIPDFKIRYMVDTYWKKNGKVRYIALVSSIFEYGYQVVPVGVKDQITKELTEMKIYIFDEQLDADDFGLQVSRYFEIGDPHSGLKFWKTFNELIEKSINYKEINNMSFSVEGLDMAYKLKKKPQYKIMQEGKNKKATKAADTEDFA